MNPAIDWHSRFRQQAGWTRELRSYLFKNAKLKAGDCILEAGCGTGAILADIPVAAGVQVHGLDIAPEMLKQAMLNAPSAHLVIGDAHILPYPNEIFDITFCHYLLLWVASPLEMLQEMKRVTRKGGVVMAMAEPDYSSRSDEPDFMAELGKLQTAALLDQGADIRMGAKLGDLFNKSGINLVECGWMQDKQKGERQPGRQKGDDDLEWRVLETDLKDRLIPAQLEQYHLDFLDACNDDSIHIHIPTAFAWGTV